jgi:hypothetical protein
MLAYASLAGGKRITFDVKETDRQALMAIVADRNSPQKHVCGRRLCF